MRNEILKKSLKLTGVTPIMFDPFYGQEEIPPEKKFYFAKDDKTLVLPNGNILGFLSSQKVHSCLRLFAKSTEWQIRTNEIAGCVSITPAEIPFRGEDGKPLEFSEWNSGQIWLDTRMVSPNKQVKMMVSRPVLDLPWSLEFELSVFVTEFITMDRMMDWFRRGGFQVGLCAHRPLFGRFKVEEKNHRRNNLS